MQYLIINKTIKFLLFASCLFLISCSSFSIRSLTQTKFSEPGDTVQTVVAINKDNHHTETPQANNDLWQRLFALYQLPQVDNDRVQAQIDWYSKHPNYIKQVQKNAAPYLYYIVNEVEKRQLPGELALLPIIESAYRPFAYSHGRAAGLWQFIPSTGRYYGLKQSWWYDGRRDVHASTQAALTYLSKLSKRFDNDWFLALAAYNAGGGTVSNAIKQNRKRDAGTDYWSLALRKETRQYVPKLLAIAHILSNAEQYGIELQAMPNTAYFETIDTVKQIDLARASELADISIDELYQLNPAFNQWATDPHGPHYLLIPVDKALQFKQGISQLADEQRVKWQRHKVKSGETLSHIARRYRTSVALIKQTNRISSHSIRAGKYLLIPTARYDESLYSRSTKMRKKAIVNKPRSGERLQYRVKQGDSFWRIAQQHQVSVRQLAKWNAMAPGDLLKPNQLLNIWLADGALHPTTQVSPLNKHQTIRYTVKNGDSLYLISKRFKVDISDLKHWNQLNKKYLKPGQKLKIIVDVTRS